jgi:hypothetical protein
MVVLGSRFLRIKRPTRRLQRLIRRKDWEEVVTEKKGGRRIRLLAVDLFLALVATPCYQALKSQP